MKLKNFQEYLEERLDKDTIARIEEQALREVRMLRQIQETLKLAIIDYMESKNIGFNELVKRLNSSPAQVTKIQKGEANLTLSSLAHILALLEKEPQDVFKSKKKQSE